MKFGYARVSKNAQSLDIQIKKLMDAGCEEIFQEKISGAKDDRPQLDALMNKLRKSACGSGYMICGRHAVDGLP